MNSSFKMNERDKRNNALSADIRYGLDYYVRCCFPQLFCILVLVLVFCFSRFVYFEHHIILFNKGAKRTKLQKISGEKNHTKAVQLKK